MSKRGLNLSVIAAAVRRRAERFLGRERDYFPGTPPGLALSPSARHFADYETAPLALRFSGQGGDVSRWQATARAKLAELSGYRRETKSPKIVHDSIFPLPEGLSRRAVYLNARTGVDIPVHLIGPPGKQQQRPVMICLQGTNSGAHLSWGEARFPADHALVGQGYDLATQAAKRGYLSVAIEQNCFGERAERQIDPRSAALCVDATMHSILLGRSLIGERSSDVSAVIDWLEAEHESLGIDVKNIHVMGHSSGGSVALFAAALDTRISAVLACGCVGYIRDTIGRRRDDQGQNVIPGILNWLEMADIAGLVAPRPFVTVAGETDHIWPAAGCTAVIEEAKAIYSKCNATDRLLCVTEPGGHKFRPDASWRAFFSVVPAPRGGI